MKFLLFCILFSSFQIFAQNNEAGLSSEIDASEVKLREIEEGQEDFWNFKLKLSEFITFGRKGFFSSSETRSYQSEMVSNLENVSQKIESIKIEVERLDGQLVLLKQNKEVQEEALKLTKDQEEKSFIKNILVENKKDVRRIKKLKKSFLKNKKRLEAFTVDLKKWRDNFARLVKTKEISKNIFNWRINQTFFSPKEEFSQFVQDINKQVVQDSKAFQRKSFRDNSNKLIFVLVLFVLIGGYLFYAQKKLQKGIQSSNHFVQEALGHVGTFQWSIYLLFGLFVGIKVSEFILPQPPMLTITMLNWIGLSYLWMKFRKVPLDLIFGKERQWELSNFLVIVFLLFTSLENQIKINSDLFYLVKASLFLFIGRSLFKQTWLIAQESKSGQSKASLLFLSILVLMAAGEFLGFTELSRLGQRVFLSNIISIVLVVIFYQIITQSVSSQKEKWEKVLTTVGVNNSKDINSYLQSSFKLISFLLLGYLVLNTWAKQVFLENHFLDVEVFKIGSFKLTLAEPVNLIFSYLIIRGLYIFSLWALEHFWFNYFDVTERFGANIKTIVRYLFILVFLSVGLNILGVTYQNVLILASALGVGIGFGLQNIVNNFVSGIVLLFERPIRVGDVIEIEGLMCRVMRIGMRSTIVESIDNSNIIIPNSEILSNKLTNWTLNDNIIGINCEVGVAYGSDTDEVTNILLSCIDGIEEVVHFPKPQVWFEEFGDSSLNFKIKFWLDDPSKRFKVRSRVMHTINQKLKGNNITIPFPQRDVHLVKDL